MKAPITVLFFVIQKLIVEVKIFFCLKSRLLFKSSPYPNSNLKSKETINMSFRGEITSDSPFDEYLSVEPVWHGERLGPMPLDLVLNLKNNFDRYSFAKKSLMDKIIAVFSIGEDIGVKSLTSSGNPHNESLIKQFGERVQEMKDSMGELLHLKEIEANVHCRSFLSEHLTNSQFLEGYISAFINKCCGDEETLEDVVNTSAEDRMEYRFFREFFQSLETDFLLEKMGEENRLRKELCLRIVAKNRK